jgi:hypothetical protein
MTTYIPPEKMTADQIRAKLQERFARWDEINEHGCTDPFWADGINMNLVRNHIIYYYGLLADKLENAQLSLFDSIDLTDLRPIPPKVDPEFMSPTGRYPDRLKRRMTNV